jgi:flagellar hook assembly protein FlgD
VLGRAQAVGDQTPVPVKLQIFNLLGQSVKTLVNDVRTPGLYSVEWDGTDLRGNKISTGIYFYRLISGKFSETKKMMFLK